MNETILTAVKSHNFNIIEYIIYLCNILKKVFADTSIYQMYMKIQILIFLYTKCI